MSYNRKVRFLPIVESEPKPYYYYDLKTADKITLDGQSYIRKYERERKIDELLDECPIIEALEKMEWQRKLK